MSSLLFDSQPVIVACWLIFGAYWFVSALSVKATQQSRGWVASNWHRILLIIGYLFMLNFRFFRPNAAPVEVLATPLIPRSVLTDVLAVALGVSGLIVAIVARRTLAGNWSGAVVIKQDQELITTGPYYYVRHPIYSGMALMTLGAMFSLCTLGSLIGMLFIFAAIAFKIRDEEQLLSQHFVTGYLAYKQQTKRLIPFVW